MNHDDDLAFCCSIFGDQEIMNLYSVGVTRNEQRVSNWLQILEKRWLGGDPFSAFIVRVKPDVKNAHNLKTSKAGFYNMGHGRAPGVAELGIVSSKLCQQLDLTDEISNALLTTWPKVLMKLSQECGPQGKKGKFNTIAATALIENKASIHNLEKYGFNQDQNWDKTRLMEGGTYKGKTIKELYYYRTAVVSSDDSENKDDQ